ncbi:MAG: MoaD/ThiS family protein [Chloroflexi bacterium]|nr:MoaD/ThiS family protein [Chloroflexota bacterium]
MAVYHVRLIGGLRTAAGGKVVDVHMGTENSVRGLLNALRRDHPALAAHLLDDDGQLFPDMLLLVNSQPIYALNGLDTPLNEQDDVMMIPPLSGG